MTGGEPPDEMAHGASPPGEHSPVTSAPPDIVPRVVAGLLLAAGLAVGVLIVSTQTDSVTGLLDLRIYLGAARSLRDGGSIYAYTDPSFHLGSTYPPLWSVLLLPVAHVDLHLAEYLWTALNELLWLATLFVLARGTTARLAPSGSSDSLPGAARNRWFTVQVLLVWLITIPSAPVWNTLNQGQLNIVLWFLVVVDLIWVAERRRYGGFLTGIASALKLIPALSIAFFAFARRGRAVANAVAVAVFSTAVAWAIAPDDSRRYWTDLLFDTSRVGDIDGSQNNSLRFLLQNLGLHDRVEVTAWVALVIVALAISLPVYRRALDTRSPITAATLVGAVGALASPISWTHHLVFLCFPLLLLVGPPAGPRATTTGGRRLAFGALVVGAILLVDPVGFGRSVPTSVVRSLLLCAVVAGARPLLDAERRRAHNPEPTGTSLTYDPSG